MKNTLVVIVGFFIGVSAGFQNVVKTDDVAFKAGGQNVILPKGFVLYPVSEQDAKDECYPGAHYKIYVSLENSSQQLKAIAWPKGRTNLIERLTK